MNARNLILVALIALVGGGAAFLFFGEDDSPGPVAPGAQRPRDAAPDEPMRGATRAAEDAARTDVALDPSDPEAAARQIEDLADREAMALTGRVVDTAGAPVVGAEVALRTRIDPRRFFENGGARGFDPGSFDPRGGRGGGGADFRDLFRGAVAADPVVTDGQGRFRFDAKAYRSGTLELTVDHDRFAPAAVRRDWEDDEKDVELEPIVLSAGVQVTGNVVDANGNSVVGAAVKLASANGGFGGFGGGRGGRGGRGGPPFGGDDALLELIDSAETDATGHFVIDHVPAGQIRVRAEMSGHLPSESERKDGEDGATLDVGVIELGPGAVLRGVVVDAYGNPIEGAEVVATVSRDAAFSELRELPDEIQQELRRAMGRFMGARQETETDAEGRFELDMVPDRAVRLEVDHPDYISKVEEPVEPLSTPNVQLTLAETLGLAGRIVDATTGAPVETFGIRARQVRDLGGMGGFGNRQRGPGGRGENGGDGNAERLAEFEARIAEFQAGQEREQAKVQQLVGGSGEIPGRTPDPEAHPQGRFDLGGLQPGTYVLDIEAPGYVKIAAGRYELSADATSPTELTIQLERGTTVTGVVVDAENGVAVANARVSLEVPQEQDGSPMNDLRNGMRAMFGGRGGRGGGGMSLQAVRTDRDGHFEFAPTRAGNYALSIEAEGFPGIDGRAFPVPGNTPTHDVRISLDNGARVFGNVLGLEAGQRARVVFTQVDGNERRTADVNPENSSYEVEGLLAGGYRVRVEMRGRDGGDFRDRIGQALAERMDGQPDLFVPASGEVRYDVGAEGSELGRIEGRVFKNGNPGNGLEVRLAAVENPNDDPARRLIGRMSRLLSARVDETGNFALESVPPGQYFIEVYAGGGGGGRGGRGGGGPQLRFGGGNGAALIRQPINVMAGQTVPQVLSVDTGGVALRFVDAEGKPVGRARVELVRADESAGVEPAQWRDLPSHYATGLRDGALEIETAPVGTWKYSLQAGSGQPLLGEILVTPGVTTEAEVQVPASQGGN